MNTNTSSAIVSQYQLDVCLETARDAVVDCENFLRTNAPDNSMKAVRQLRKRLYSVFVQADDCEASAFDLSKEVDACVASLAVIVSATAVVVH